MTTHQHNQNGFTLIEIMVVVVILSIFAGMMSLSVGSSEARKSRAYYEHLQDSLKYMRLLSAERMQPMGIMLRPNSQGQLEPQAVYLTDPYYAQKQAQQPSTDPADVIAKSNMELSMSIDNNSNKPTWQPTNLVTLPSPPTNVQVNIRTLEVNSNTNNTLQPWFSGQQMPQIIWFGNGAATPSIIEVTIDKRLVADDIMVMSDGSIRVADSP